MAALKLMAPSLILLATAGVVSTASLRAYLNPSMVRAVAVGAVLVALIVAVLVSSTIARLASLPLGAVSASMIELRLGPLSLGWLQLLLLGAAALVLVSPLPSIPTLLALLGLVTPALLVGSLPAVCLFWFVTEVALAFARGRASPGVGNSLLPVFLGTAAVIAAFHASASDEALVLSLGSLRPSSWLLLVAAIGLRLRAWSPTIGPNAEDTLPVVTLLAAGATGFFTLSHLDTTPRTGEAPEWLALLLLALAVVTAALAWAHRRAWPGAPVWAAGAMLTALLLPAALAFPPAAWVGPGAAHVLVALVAYVALGWLPRPAWLPYQARPLAMAAVALSLFPWPVLPYGRAVTWAIDLLSGFRPAGSVLLSLTAGLPAAALLTGLRMGLDTEARTTSERATASAALLLAAAAALVAIRLATPQAGAQALFPAAEPSFGALALAALSGFLGLGLAVASRAGLLSTLDTEVLPERQLPAPEWLTNISSAIASGAEMVFRLLEGETPLTWAVLIGAAVLILAAG